eukprot:GHVL01025297.1.p1 GENE.GHVL01025297.1~~GHVL01025297.1.p1  ORF type:complete len:492 (+),score=42.69 GHVL01025297.1:33-1508(+)
MNIRITIGSYAAISLLVALGLIFHVCVAFEQIYPATIYLSTNKLSLAILCNFIFMVFLVTGKFLTKILFGSLRDREIEELISIGKEFLTETILYLIIVTPKIEGRHVSQPMILLFVTGVLILRIFHHVCDMRTTQLFQMGVPRLFDSIRSLFLINLLLVMDFWTFFVFLKLNLEDSSLYVWVLFESLKMGVNMLFVLVRWTIQAIDGNITSGWTSKAAYLFLVDLLSDVSYVIIFVWLISKTFGDLPLFFLWELVTVCRNVYSKLKSYRQYRKLIANMDSRFPVASPEEIVNADTCIICRDVLATDGRKLPCGHILHGECLKSWFVQQQICPICRAEVLVNPRPTSPPTVEDSVVPEETTEAVDKDSIKTEVQDVTDRHIEETSIIIQFLREQLAFWQNNSNMSQDIHMAHLMKSPSFQRMFLDFKKISNFDSSSYECILNPQSASSTDQGANAISASVKQDMELIHNEALMWHNRIKYQSKLIELSNLVD